MPTFISAEVEMQVPFYDVDSYRIVWHGNYPKYFEVAREALLEKIGYTYADMEASGYLFPVIDLNVRYVDTLKFKQHIRIKATLVEWQHKLTVRYLITDLKSGKKMTKGSTSQVAVQMPEHVMQFQSPAILIDKVNAALNTTTQN